MKINNIFKVIFGLLVYLNILTARAEDKFLDQFFMFQPQDEEANRIDSTKVDWFISLGSFDPNEKWQTKLLAKPLKVSLFVIQDGDYSNVKEIYFLIGGPEQFAAFVPGVSAPFVARINEYVQKNNFKLFAGLRKNFISADVAGALSFIESPCVPLSGVRCTGDSQNDYEESNVFVIEVEVSLSSLGFSDASRVQSWVKAYVEK